MIKRIMPLIALLFFATCMLGMQRCFVCEGMRQEPFVTLTCNHTCHPSCILFICDATKCPQCNYAISPERKAEILRMQEELGRHTPRRVYPEHQKCYICDDRIAEFKNLPMVFLNCNHAYHAVCILTWSNTNSTCPQCKSRISDDQIEYFEYIVNDDAQPPSAQNPQSIQPAQDTPPQSRSLMSTYRPYILLSCGSITALVCYYYQDDIMAWFKKGSHKQQELL